MPTNATHQRTLARQLAEACGLTYQQALERVRTAAAQGKLPAKLDQDGLREALRILTGATHGLAGDAVTGVNEPTPSPRRTSPTSADGSAPADQDRTGGVWANVIRSSDITRCPKMSLLPAHYRTDGTCRCNEHDEAAAEVTRAEEAFRSAKRDLKVARDRLAAT